MESNKETYSFLQFNTVFIPLYCNHIVCLNLQTQNYTLNSDNAQGHFRNSNYINRILEFQTNNSNSISQNLILPTENEPQIQLILMAQDQAQNCQNNENIQEDKNSQDNLDKQKKKDIKNLQDHLMQLGKSNWTTKQQQKLIQLFNLFGKRWKYISQHFPNRTGKQIREKYLNYLRPNLSLKRWTPEEDNNIIQLVKKYGRSWRRIEKKLRNRSQNQIKNRYYGHLQKSQKLSDKIILAQAQNKKQDIKTEASLVNYEQSIEPIQA